jgi:ribosomal protein L37AE/L43A
MAVKPYTDLWLKEVRPAEYAAGWRFHPKGGLRPPVTIKPKKKPPASCKSCGCKKFDFMATGIDSPEYHWQCDKCGRLYPAR